MTNDELGRLKALCEAATPGPWEWHGTNCHILNADYFDPTGQDHSKITSHSTVIMMSSQAGSRMSNENRRFIAASRTAVPALIAEVERLRVALDAHTAEVERLTAELSEANAMREPKERRCGTCAAWRHIEDDEGLCLALPMIQGKMTHMNRDGDQCALWRERGEG